MKKFLESKLFKTLVTILIVAGISWSHSALETMDNILSRQAEKVKINIEAGEWELAEKEATELREKFEDKRWGLEFFGPTEHVTVTRYKIISLVTAVQQENEDTSLELLAKIKERLDEFVVF